MIRFVGGFVGLIFGLAGVLNLMNTIITTILTRRHEFAAMESVGMTRGQLTKMMVYEGVYYAAVACVLGVILAAVLDLTLVKGLVDSIERLWQPVLSCCLYQRLFRFWLCAVFTRAVLWSCFVWRSKVVIVYVPLFRKVRKGKNNGEYFKGGWP